LRAVEKARDEVEVAAWAVVEAARELGRTLAKHEPIEREEPRGSSIARMSDETQEPDVPSLPLEEFGRAS
jgi:hypothetical protein